MPSQDGRRAVLPWKKAFDAHLARVGHSCWLAKPQRAQPANGLIGMNSTVPSVLHHHLGEPWLRLGSRWAVGRPPVGVRPLPKGDAAIGTQGHSGQPIYLTQEVST